MTSLESHLEFPSEAILGVILIACPCPTRGRQSSKQSTRFQVTVLKQPELPHDILSISPIRPPHALTAPVLSRNGLLNVQQKQLLLSLPFFPCFYQRICPLWSYAVTP